MTLARMTLADEGMLDLGAMQLEYRMIGPRPDAGPRRRRGDIRRRKEAWQIADL